MRHMLFAASFLGVLCLANTVLSAQSVPASRRVPGRALLDLPLGTLGEAPALAIAGGGGLFDPAAILIPPLARLRVAVAQLDAPGVRGLHGQTGTVTARVGRTTALGVGVARMSVGGGDRTSSSGPQVLGSVPYHTYVVSLIGAHRVGGPLGGHLVVGAAGRYRAARSDTSSASTTAFDVGVLGDRLFGRLDGRVALSSYLWRPGDETANPPGIHAGADVRVAGRDDVREARVGVARESTRGGTRETYLYGAGRWRFAELRGGIGRQSEFGDAQTLLRLGVGFRSDRFTVGVGREDSSRGFGAMYQFSMSAFVR